MPKKILIVDDMGSLRLWMKMVLEREGYQVQEAANGAEALEQIAASPPDIVFMDVLMPVVDGIECCRRIKSNPATKSITVIMVTSNKEYPLRKGSFSAGCDAFLTKPIAKEDLLATVGLWLIGK